MACRWSCTSRIRWPSFTHHTSQYSTTFEKYSMSFRKYSMTFARILSKIQPSEHDFSSILVQASAESLLFAEAQLRMQKNKAFMNAKLDSHGQHFIISPPVSRRSEYTRPSWACLRVGGPGGCKTDIEHLTKTSLAKCPKYSLPKVKRHHYRFL